MFLTQSFDLWKALYGVFWTSLSSGKSYEWNILDITWTAWPETTFGLTVESPGGCWDWIGCGRGCWWHAHCRARLQWKGLPSWSASSLPFLEMYFKKCFQFGPEWTVGTYAIQLGLDLWVQRRRVPGQAYWGGGGQFPARRGQYHILRA